MTNKEYHSLDALGSTNIKQIVDNIRIFKFGTKKNPQCFELGELFHTYILEPENAKNWEIVGTWKTRCKSFLELQETTDHKLVLESELNFLAEMKSKAHKLPNFDNIVKNSEIEKSFFAEFETELEGKKHQIKVKCRPDMLYKNKDGRYSIIDLKSTKEQCTPNGLKRDYLNFKRPIQAQFYKRVLEANGYEIADFLFAYVSKDPDSLCGWVKYREEDEQWADDYINNALFKYIWCKENDSFLEGSFNYVDGGFKVFVEF